MFKLLPRAVRIGSRVGRWVGLGLACVLGSTQAQEATAPGRWVTTQGAEHTRQASAPTPARATSALPLVLPPVSENRLALETTPTDKTQPPKIGFPRALPDLKANTAWTWTLLPEGGQVTAVSLTSPGAMALRAGLHITALPKQARLRVYTQAQREVLHQFSGAQMLQTLDTNLASGDRRDDARTFWTPMVLGEEVTLELELPTGANPSDVQLNLPTLSHLFLTPEAYEDQRVSTRAAASCHLDATCYASSWDNISKAVALMTFVDGGYSYTCTGTLLNDMASSHVPYFLSANHCISTQTTASTLQTTWFYRAPSCNAVGSSTATTNLSGGATLLYQNAGTDTSFLRLNADPPAGAYQAGWWASLPGVGVGLTGVHHPKADRQKISFGSVYTYYSCSTGSESFSCSATGSSLARFIGVKWSEGVTEGGSSGSGIWAPYATGDQRLVGQLYGGGSSCSAPTATDYYGRLDLAYEAALYQWLGSSTAPSTRTLTVTRSGSGTVVSSPSGINCGSDCSEAFANGTVVTLTATPSAGSSLLAWTGACTGSASTCVVTMNATQAVQASFVTGLRNGVAVSSLSGTGTAENFYAIDLPSGATNLRITTTGGAGDVDLYVRRGVVPTRDVYDCASTSYTTLETCSITTPVGGSSYYLLLAGFGTGYSGVTLTASYTLANTSYSLTLNRVGTGSGTVSSTPIGINCGSDCSESYASGTSVTLVATAASGSVFAGWTGSCLSGGGSSNFCTVTLDSARFITATFTAVTNANDCLLNWMEDRYSGFFNPSRSSSRTQAPYVYRYYSATGAYLGVSSSDSHLYFYSLLTGLVDLGTASTWSRQAGCS